MGSGTQSPQYVQPRFDMDYSIGSNLDNGKDLLSKVMGQINSQGLPEHIKKQREQSGLGAIAGGRQTGLNDLKKSFDNPAAIVGGLGNINQNATQGMQSLYGGLAEQDYSAMVNDQQRGFGNFANLTSLASGIGSGKNQLRLGQSDSQNQYAMKKYETDKANEFSWGDLAGAVLGTGGQLGSAAMGKPKKK